MADMESWIAATERFVKQRLTDVVTGHDWEHVERVRQTAQQIAMHEGADLGTVTLAALLHDLDDHKFSGRLSGPAEAAQEWLQLLQVDSERIQRVVEAASAASFSLSRPAESLSPEGECVRDADRLDALGAVGIARAFAYGGWAGNAMFQQLDGSKSTVDHFFEKLLLLAGTMTTHTGRELAKRRHAYLRDFLSELSQELGHQDPLRKELAKFYGPNDQEEAV